MLRMERSHRGESKRALFRLTAAANSTTLVSMKPSKPSRAKRVAKPSPTEEPVITFATNCRGDTFTIGDWVIAETGIYQLRELHAYDNGRRIVADRSNGCVLVGGNLDDCWKLTLSTKVIAEGVERYADKLRKLPGERSFNWPALSRKLTEFAEIGYLLDKQHPRSEDCDEDCDENAKVRELYETQLWEPLEAWYQEIKEIADATSLKHVGGVRLFR